MSKHSSRHSADAILATKGKSFHWARRLLGKEYALRATRLYRFCRYIDDLVDEAESSELAEKGLVEVSQAILSGQSNHEVVRDGLSLMKECHIPQAVVLDLIAGATSDIALVRIQDQDALLRYCYQVAGTVGLMMSNVLDTHEDAAKPYAVDLGMAMQLTNICRDIKTDALLNRRYVPGDLVKDLEPISLIYPNEQQKQIVSEAVANLLDCAEKYYSSGERGLSYLPLKARLSILVAARVYREIGRELKKQHCEYWHRRIVISSPRKVIITLQALLSVCFNLQFWRHPKSHDLGLHRALLDPQTQAPLSIKSYAG
ncbi:phytoene synthase [Polynucleobacter meluiroseus]|uniref:Phytoene synthase n=1 Tax=Polynucleobacter meluiroseus TaxID=1938814 RepID=A0A240DYA6_9BURK|nr:phytoene/squalene synthase family protein [Polynucleobacter meluiroseus]SNX27912.1 phytoene synthase [Polynucleobacter meluiroseus]